jgi:uncharacterized protein (DUF1778 family)
MEPSSYWSTPTSTPHRTSSKPVLATAAQVETIREAARATQRSVTAFVTETAYEEAQRILTDASHFILREAEGRAFTEILERPATAKPKLAALLTPANDTR